MFFTTDLSLFSPSKISLELSMFLVSVSTTVCPVSSLTPPSKWVSLKMTSSCRVVLFCSWLLLYLFNGKLSPDMVDIWFVFMTSSCWYISVGTTLPLIFANLLINRLASLVLLLLISHLRDSGKNLAWGEVRIVFINSLQISIHFPFLILTSRKIGTTRSYSNLR